MFKGVPLNMLTDMEGGEERIIRNAPEGTLDEVGGSGKTPFFGLRLAYCKPVNHRHFVSMRQALINCFGEPAWINLYAERVWS